MPRIPGRTTAAEQTARAARALAAFGLQNAPLRHITVGHINGTWHVTAGGRTPRNDGDSDGDGDGNGRTGDFILQRLSPIFDPKVNLDLEALTGHLAAAGLTTPRLVRTTGQAAWHEDDAGDVYRLLTYVPGHVLAHADAPAPCRGAGALLGRFHRALAGVDHTFAARRLGVHDTPRHLAGLRAAVAAHAAHPAHAEVARRADALFAAMPPLEREAALPQRIVHGDAKLSNVIFATAAADPHTGAWRARAMVDLDTLAPMAVHLELGDALRSWCNPAGEGPAPATFRLDYLAAAAAGYAEGAANLLTAAEVHAIAPGIAQITLELCARFLRDALEETYFAWDAQNYAHAWQHHLVRARSQWDGYVALAAHGQAPAAVVAQAFGLTT